jgi:hypothetical protein
MRIETVVLVFILQVTFFAGVFWAVTRASIVQLRKDQEEENADLRKDLTGIGEKVRQTESKVWYIAWMLTPEEKREEVLNAMVRRLN